MKQGCPSGSGRLQWSIGSTGGMVHHTTVCSVAIPGDASPLCAIAVVMEWPQAPGHIKYLRKENSSGQTNKGEELFLLSSAIGLRIDSKSWEGVEQHACKGSLAARKAGRDWFCS